MATRRMDNVSAYAEYENIDRLCFVRGPEGIILGLAEQLG